MAMQSEITLNLTAEIDQITKQISKFVKKAEIDLSQGITKSLNDGAKTLKEAFAKNMPTEQINALKAKLKEASAVKLELDMNEATKKIDNMRYQLVGMYASVKGLVGKPINVAMEFETAMADVKKVVDFDDAVELKGFEDKIWNLTREIPLAAKDLTAIVASGGQLGLDKNILIPFTNVTAKMATAFDMNTTDAGNAIAKLMNNLSLEIDEVKELGDAINYLGATSAGAPREIVEILGRTAGMAKTMKMNGVEASILAGAFANMKVPAEKSATAINKMLSVLGGADVLTPKATKALEKLGMSANDLKRQMSNNPLEAIENVMRRISNLNDDQKIGVLKNLFGEEAGPKIALITANMESFAKIKENLSKKSNYADSMEKEFKAVSATTANSIQLMKSAFERVGRNIGLVFLPAINSVANAVASITNKISNFMEKNEGLAKTIVWVGGAFLGAKAALVAFRLVSAMSSLAILPLQHTFRTLAINTAGYTSALNFAIIKQKAFNALAMFRGGGIGGIAKGGVGILGSLFNFGALKSTILNFLPFIKTAFRVALTGLRFAGPIGIIITAITLIWKFWAQIKAFFSGVFSGIKQGLEPAIKSLKTAFAPIFEAFSRIKAALAPAFEAIGNAFGKLFSQSEGTKESLGAIARVGEMVGKVLGLAFRISLIPLELLAKAIAWVVEKIAWIIESISNSFIGKAISSFFDDAKESAPNYKESSQRALETAQQNRTNLSQNNQTINDHKVINITTSANANDVARAIQFNSYAD